MRGKKVTLLTSFMSILSNKTMQNYPKNYPQKGVRVICPDSVVMNNGQFPFMLSQSLPKPTQCG